LFLSYIKDAISPCQVFFASLDFFLALPRTPAPARGEPGTIAIPAELAARASFQAQVHRASGVEEWLTRVIRERIELEEEAFAEAKRDLSEKREP
jgi:hypothetical protein